MVIVKRLLFLNLFERDPNKQGIESREQIKTAYKFQVIKPMIYQYRSLLLIINTILSFLIKFKVVQNTIKAFQRLMPESSLDHEVILVFYNLEKMFVLSKQDYESIFFLSIDLIH